MRRVLAIAVGAGAFLGYRSVVRYRRRFNFRDRTVLITGGSRGLGLVLAREFVRRGARPVLLARSHDDLGAARKEFQDEDRVLTIPCDVRDSRQVEDAVREIIRKRGVIDILINNAGIIQVGPQEQMTIEEFDDAMLTHFWGPLYMMLAVIPYMLRQGAGRIVNIASFGGKVSVPHLLPYCASKFALVGLSNGMRSELAKHNIRVTTVSPGLMRTGSHINIAIKGDHEKEFAWFSISAGMPLISMNAERAAKKIVDACDTGRAALDLGWAAKFVIIAQALAPSLTGEVIAFADRLLPKPVPEGNEIVTGWQSLSRWAPSFLTRLADAAIEKNNELRGHSPVKVRPS